MISGSTGLIPVHLTPLPTTAFSLYLVSVSLFSLAGSGKDIFDIRMLIFYETVYTHWQTIFRIYFLSHLIFSLIYFSFQQVQSWHQKRSQTFSRLKLPWIYELVFGLGPEFSSPCSAADKGSAQLHKFISLCFSLHVWFPFNGMVLWAEFYVKMSQVYK